MGRHLMRQNRVEPFASSEMILTVNRYKYFTFDWQKWTYTMPFRPLCLDGTHSLWYSPRQLASFVLRPAGSPGWYLDWHWREEVLYENSKQDAQR